MAQTKCKGLFFRFRKSAYFNKILKSVTYKHEVKLLKRQSCRGCPDCTWIFDSLADQGYGEDLEDLIQLERDRFGDGEKLKLRVKCVGQDIYYFTFDYPHILEEVL